MATVREVKPLRPVARWQTVGIYARISTTRKGQLNSIANQVSQLTDFVYKRFGWVLVDIYLDFESGSGSHFRPQFARMIKDAQEGKFEILLTKSVTRFGRNTVENLEIMRLLLKSGVVVYFHMEDIESSQPDAEFLVSLLSGIAEADNNSHREDRIWGMKRKIEDGTSELYRRPCYGYEKNQDGVLTINRKQAGVVRDIFKAYLDGKSISGIQKMLEQRQIPSPKGGAKWPARTIDFLLSNEKYTGEIILFKTVTIGYPIGGRFDNSRGQHHERYAMSNGVEAIIDEDTFRKVQEEKVRRCPFEDGPGGVRRKKTKYSSKSLLLLSNEEVEIE